MKTFFQDEAEFLKSIKPNFQITPNTSHKNTFVDGDSIACSGITAVFTSPDATGVLKSKVSQDRRTGRIGAIQGENVHSGSLEINFDKDVRAVGIPVHGLFKCEVRIYDQAARELAKEILVFSLVDGFVGVIHPGGFRSILLKTSNTNWCLGAGAITGQTAE